MKIEFYRILLVAAMSLGTCLLRFLPFWIFNDKKHIPKTILYLGDVLPGAVLGMLVVYCLRDLNLMAAPYGGPELLACSVVVIVQLWKRNSLWSILAGTVVYMLL